VRAGLRAAHVGPRILRADTAALSALAAVNLLWGDFR
jgi:16S rRNA (uracil1498-N3)-methyltransferase